MQHEHHCTRGTGPLEGSFAKGKVFGLQIFEFTQNLIDVTSDCLVIF